MDRGEVLYKYKVKERKEKMEKIAIKRSIKNLADSYESTPESFVILMSFAGVLLSMLIRAHTVVPFGISYIALSVVTVSTVSLLLSMTASVFVARKRKR